jgi:hypothetical protein
VSFFVRERILVCGHSRSRGAKAHKGVRLGFIDGPQGAVHQQATESEPRNTDASIRRIKGPARPINSLADRIQVLAALACIDFVIAFDEGHALQSHSRLRPDVFVKGGDYTRERLPEAALVEELGGRVQIVGYLNERSTGNRGQNSERGFEPGTAHAEFTATPAAARQACARIIQVAFREEE